MANQLRFLLCSGHGNNLLQRVHPNVSLLKLQSTKIFESCPSLLEGLSYQMPGVLSASKAQKSYELLFAHPVEHMRPEEWINQPFLTKEITVKNFIRSLADKEGSHSDIEYDETLKLSMNVKYEETDSHIYNIIAIGEYILQEVAKQKLV